MSTNPNTKNAGSDKKSIPQEAQKLATKTTVDTKGKKPEISDPKKPTTPQIKSKSCCG